MCGIFGIVSHSSISESELNNGSLGVQFRGLDEEGRYLDDHCRLYHARLSIIDLSSGRQPLTERTGRYTIVFNGEIYNYLELRGMLQQAGVVFHTNSDTEVILEGFCREGRRFFQGLEGMFAFAIWDKLNKALVLCRDPLGKKPLFVYEMSGGVAFSSSLHSFRNLSAPPDRINRLGVLSYCIKGFIPAPLSIFHHCRKIRPGFVEIFHLPQNRWVAERYGGFSFPGLTGRLSRLEKAESGFKEQFRRAVAIRCRADVPVGLLFSGGVDSGLIGAFLSKESGTVPFFNIDYETAANKSPERANARNVAEMFGVDLIEADFEPSRLFADLPRAYRFHDEPCSQLPMVYFLKICEAIKRSGITVVLSGNGADELFFGYNGSYRIRRKNALLQALQYLWPYWLTPERFKEIKRRNWKDFIVRLELDHLNSMAAAFGWKASEWEEGLDGYLESLKEEVEAVNMKTFMDFVVWSNLRVNGAAANYLLPDVNGLQTQVEIRSPFLDLELIQFVNRLQSRLKIGSLYRDRYNKYLLKKLYAESVGPSIAYDAKRGMAWNIRWDQWIAREPDVVSFFRQVIGRLEDFGIAPDYFERHYRNYCNADRFGAPGGDQAVIGFMLAAWCIKEFEGSDNLRALAEPLEHFQPTTEKP